jgi:hypothetical protein
MLRSPLALALIAAAIAAGCGDDSAEAPARHGDPAEDAYFSRHPEALTCGHVLAIDSVKAAQFHKAAYALADDVRLPGTHRNIIWGRFVYALLDLCQKSDDPDYRPAADAARLVAKGRYVVTGAPTEADVRRINAERERRTGGN